MSTLSLTNPEAPLKYDWKLPVFLVVMNIIGVAVQWGVISSKLDELFRAKDQQERHIEFIDNEIRQRVGEAGQAKEFHDETLRRLDKIDSKLDVLEQKRQ